ncbi:DUF6461 domain-containing protein [Amycolatopsis pigmentata]|uniref:DUF6461 domain-containing protein n=1 Tax=Amycolatopsis pigmentata TaxID=450801 RepID=A0ABW5FXP7_9PSEU
MPQLIRQFETLAEPVTSKSGAWALRYDSDGRATISDRNGKTTWTAGAVGTLRLEMDGVFVVYDGDRIAWRGDVPELGYTSFGVTDDGDGVIYDNGLPKYSLRHGPIEPVSLGDRAPVTEIRDNRFLESGNGKRTVNRTPDGDALVHTTKYGIGARGIVVVPPADTRALEQPDTWLTWRFLDDDGNGRWNLVLVGPDDEVLWAFGERRPVKPEPEPSPVVVDTMEGEEGAYSDEWLETGLGGMEGGYCVTAIQDVDPDEALRRFGAEDAQISTSTWAELLRRASYEDVDVGHHVVAAFGFGPHTLLVENVGWEGTRRPDLSRGTFAVSSYCSINADQRFLVSQDGETLAAFDDGYASYAEGANPDVLTDALAEMGIDDCEAFDADDDNFLEDLELLCRLAGVRPTVADVTGPARVAILPRELPLGFPAA